MSTTELTFESYEKKEKGKKVKKGECEMKPKKFKGYSIEGKNGTVYAYEMICYQETAFEIKRDKKNLEMLVYVDYSYPVAVDVELILKAIEYAKEYFNKIGE